MILNLIQICSLILLLLINKNKLFLNLYVKIQVISRQIKLYYQKWTLIIKTYFKKYLIFKIKNLYKYKIKNNKKKNNKKWILKFNNLIMKWSNNNKIKIINKEKFKNNKLIMIKNKIRLQ